MSNAVKWDGLSDTANSFIGEDYHEDWEYAKVGSQDIIINPRGKHRGSQVYVRLGEVIHKKDDGTFGVSSDDKDRGIYEKFIVKRTDGRDAPGEKHHGCEYFCLDLTHDKHALAAIFAYAKSCEDEYPLLAKDLREKRIEMAKRFADAPPIFVAHAEDMNGTKFDLMKNRRPKMGATVIEIPANTPPNKIGEIIDGGIKKAVEDSFKNPVLPPELAEDFANLVEQIHTKHRKSLYNTDANGTRKNVKDVKVFGDGDLFKLISKASSESEGWMKSTKAMATGNGVVVQVTTQQRNGDGTYAVAEALTFVPGAIIVIDPDGNRRVQYDNGGKYGDPA